MFTEAYYLQPNRVASLFIRRRLFVVVISSVFPFTGRRSNWLHWWFMIPAVSSRLILSTYLFQCVAFGVKVNGQLGDRVIGVTSLVKQGVKEWIESVPSGIGSLLMSDRVNARVQLNVCLLEENNTIEVYWSMFVWICLCWLVLHSEALAGIHVRRN